MGTLSKALVKAGAIDLTQAFQLTSELAMHTDDHIAACQKEFGQNASVVDWSSDLKRYHQNEREFRHMIWSTNVDQQSITGKSYRYFVTNNIKQYEGNSDRAYFFENHRGGQSSDDRKNYEQLGSLFLGSKSNIIGHVLCKFTGEKTFGYAAFI